MLADQLVQAALAQHAVPVLVDVDAVRGARRLAVEEDPERDRVRAPGASTRCASRAWNRKAMRPPAWSSDGALAPDRPLAVERPVVEAAGPGSA